MQIQENITKEIMEAILKAVDEGIHVIDMKGNTIFYNKVASSHDGMTSKEVLGKPLLEVFPSLTEKTSTLLQVIRTGQPIFHQNQKYRNIHGVTIDTVNTTLPIFVQEKLVGAVEVAKDISQLRMLSERMLDLEKKHASNASGKKKKAKALYQFVDIKTVNSDFLRIIDMGKRAARSSSSVLVYGESGTGKELFVQSIHAASPRQSNAFIAQNCAALPESLLESLLFGTSKGSYTGAVDRPGLFELADEGTLFLDEIQSMSTALQSKLLRVLEDGVVRRVGATKNIHVNVRVIAAMNIHPSVAMEEQGLRQDLFYRLNVLSFYLPPLRERRDDILLLAHHFLQQYNQQLRMNISGFSQNLSEVLLHHHYPGNVRELKHCIEYMMNVTETEQLQVSDLPIFFKMNDHKEKRNIPSLRVALKEKERELIEMALERTSGNVLQAAQLLKVPRQTLQYKLKNL